MTDTYTVTQLLSDESLRRTATGEVLNPGPWKHQTSFNHNFCVKCGLRIHENVAVALPAADTPCPVPDPSAGSEADIAEQLVKKVRESFFVEGMTTPNKFRDAVKLVQGASVRLPMRWVEFYIFYATPAERIVCCLVALGKRGLSHDH